MKKLDFDPYDFSRIEIDSVPIYYKNTPWANCIFLELVFKVGTINDPEGKEGLAHFLEHMMFDGSEGFPDKNSIKKWSKENTLDTFNASTSYYRTSYNLKFFPENSNKVLMDLKNIIFKPLLTQESILDEKKVVTQEAWGRYKNEKFLNYLKEINSMILPNHKLGKILRPLGFPNTIENIEREDVVKFYNENYRAGNMFLVLTGKITNEEIKMISEFVKDLPKGEFFEEKLPFPEKPTQNRIIKKSEEIGDPQEQTEIAKIITTNLPSKNDSSSFIFRDLFYDILYERLRIEKNLCYSLSVKIIEEKCLLLFIFSIKTDTKNIEVVEEEFKRILDEIKKKKWLERFELLKKIRLERIISAERLSGDIANNAVSRIIFDGEIKTLEEIIENDNKITYEDIIKFIDKTFIDERMFTEIILSNRDSPTT